MSESTTETAPITPVSKDKEEITPAQTNQREVTKAYVAIIKKNPLYSEASKVFHWRDPVRSGLLFGIFNFFFFLWTWGEYSLVTIVSYLLLTTLCICLGYANYVVLKASWLQGSREENPFSKRFKDANFHISREIVDQHVTTLIDLINTTVDQLRDVYFCTDNILSLRFALYFYLAATVGNWFSGATLLYLVTLGFFVWPRLYEEKQKEIDQFWGIAVSQCNTYYQLGISKLPPAVTSRFPALKPKSN